MYGYCNFEFQSFHLNYLWSIQLRQYISIGIGIPTQLHATVRGWLLSNQSCLLLDIELIALMSDSGSCRPHQLHGCLPSVENCRLSCWTCIRRQSRWFVVYAQCGGSNFASFPCRQMRFTVRAISWLLASRSRRAKVRLDEIVLLRTRAAVQVLFVTQLTVSSWTIWRCRNSRTRRRPESFDYWAFHQHGGIA